MKRRIPVALAALSTAAILFFTLRHGDNDLTHGWSYSLTSGDAALAELIQNLILFIPLGVSLTLALYPAGRPQWMLALINTLWMAGCVIGVGFWAAALRC